MSDLKQRIHHSFTITDESELNTLIEDVKAERDTFTKLLNQSNRFKDQSTKSWLQIHVDIYQQALDRLTNQKRNMFGDDKSYATL